MIILFVFVVIEFDENAVVLALNDVLILSVVVVDVVVVMTVNDVLVVLVVVVVVGVIVE